jgi:spore maturation protein CgeB
MLNPTHDERFKRLVLQLAASRLRISYLTAAQAFGLTIYGDGLWGKREYSGNLINSYAGRSLDYETETPDVYAASTINLNLFHPQIIEGVPMRVYDVLACGGFLLSQYRPVLEEQFTIGKDLDVFHNPHELAEKVDYYLQYEDERNAIAQHGQQTVLQHHTYSQRLQQIVEWLDG